MAIWDVRRFRPVEATLTLTEHVQASYLIRLRTHVAFKIIPLTRIPPGYFINPDSVNEWGAQLMFRGGVLGSVVAQDLAQRTHIDDVLSIEWDMPGLQTGQRMRLSSVLVKSVGDAQAFPVDPLMALHAPDLAGDTRGAHVFHFFDAQDAALFQSILCCRIRELQPARLLA